VSTAEAPTTAGGTDWRSRWLSRRALLAHLAIVIWVPGCAVAAWWQVTVALAGNDLAYLYSVEWPCFAVFAVFAWWNFIHDDPDSVGARALRRLSAPKPVRPHADEPRQPAAADDAELAAYNAYLASLAERDAPKSWKRR
jgi:DNA-binding transcriptional regulator of glucitol operon